MPSKIEPQVYASQYPSLPELPVETVWSYACNQSEEMKKALDLADENTRSDTALAFENGMTGETWTYAQVKEQTSNVAHNLCKTYGLQSGDRVLLVMPTCPQMMLIFLACQKAGIIPAACNDNYTVHELAHCLNVSRPAAVIATEEIGKRIVEADVAYQNVIVPVEDDSSLWNHVEEEDQTNFTTPKNSNETCFMAFTSGTSGLPKLAKIPMMGFNRAILVILRASGLFDGPETRVLVCLPCFHGSGLMQCIAGLVAGVQLVFCINKPFSLPALIRICGEKKITSLCLVPALINGLIKLGAAKTGAFSSLKCIGVGAAVVGEELEKNIRETFKDTIFTTGYGMTEGVSPIALSASSDPLRMQGAVGRISPGALVRVVGEDGVDVKEGESGEIWAKLACMTTGYFENDVASRELIDSNGWLHTGDIGYMGKNNNLFIIDRKKDLIKYKGLQISPAELEAILQNHPSVLESGVIGVPSHSIAQEVPKAYVVLRPGCQASGIEEILALHVSQLVSPFKWLRGGVKIVTSLPRNGTGKLLRYKLRELIN